MKNKFENILLSILLGMSVLLGLSFWLNTKFGFNIFFAAHWDKLSQLQAQHARINPWFYISIGVAIFIFIVGLYILYRPQLRNIFKHKITISVSKPDTKQPETPVQNIQIQITEPDVQKPINITRPPRLNLPKNMEQVAAEHHNPSTQIQPVYDKNPYTEKINEIFTNNAYLVKKNPTINGFTPDLFAIGNNEVLWIGAIDCNIDKMSMIIEKLQSVFQDTLPDIKITIYSFILDNKHKYESRDNIFVFYSIDDLAKFISESQGAEIPPEDQENFDAYSEYIDTIIQYVKNI